MPPEISILICSRRRGNRNSNLPRLLDSLLTHTVDYSHIEVVVKFDADDWHAHWNARRLSCSPFRTAYIIEPQGRGYLDLHIGYNRCLALTTPTSKVITAWADDFAVIAEGWDETVLARIPAEPLWILHGRPFPNGSLDWPLNHLPELELIDEAPLWSRRFIEICGGFNHSFTDAWTLLLEWMLHHQCALRLTHFLTHPIIHRNTRLWTDLMASPRSQIVRKRNFDEMLSLHYLSMVEQQAINLDRAWQEYDLPSPGKVELLAPPIRTGYRISPCAFFRQAAERYAYERPRLRRLARWLCNA